MRQYRKTNFCITLILALVMTMTGFSLAFATPEEDAAKKAESEKIEKQMQDLEKQISESRSKINSLAGEAAALDNKIQANQKKLEEQKKKLAEANENMEQRLRTMYKNGTLGFVDVILTSDSVEDLVSNVQLVSQIFTSDQDLIRGLQAGYDEIEAIQKELDGQQAQLTAKMNELSAQEERLYGAYEQLGASKERVDAEIGGAQTKIAGIKSGKKSGSSKSTQKVNAATAGKASGNGSAVVAYAMQFVGNPYKYGGTSLTNGCDCSGFTMSVYKKFGIKLPHSSGSQSAYGKKVSRSNRQPGDLVVYPGHVAIYIGNNKVVHASTPRGGIKVSNASPINGSSGTYYRML